MQNFSIEKQIVQWVSYSVDISSDVIHRKEKVDLTLLFFYGFSMKKASTKLCSDEKEKANKREKT